MRRAILDTHVILNTAITPEMILVPGSLIILKQKIPGYNSILTMANYSMSFGLNGDINKTPKTETKETKEKQIREAHRAESLTKEQQIKNDSGT